MTMRDLTDTRPKATGIAVLFTSPGGVAVKPFAEGGIAMRICLGMIENDDGLLREIEAGEDPLPWQSKDARDEALVHLGNRKALDDDTRDRLRRHILRTPYFEAG